jgi:LPXTG-motif cell wall-anchored protein
MTAALVLIALPAVAQYTTPSTTTTQPSTTTTTATPSNNLDTTTTNDTTTTTTTDTSATMETPSTTTTTTDNTPVQEERTNPAVPTHSPNSGLTASGSVVSWNNDEVVLRTATGITHFHLLPSTTGAGSFTEGQRLTIDFDRNEQGVLIAKQIRSEGTTAPVAQGITTTGAAAAGSNVAEAVEEGVEETAGADVDNDNAIGTRGGTANTAATTTGMTSTTTTNTTSSNLPATGSEAPLAGLLGLLALGGAAALRRL